MENNNNQQQYQQPQYTYQQPVQQPQYVYRQPNDPAYLAIANEYLKNAIISCCISGLPVGSIIAIFMAKKYRKQLLEYLEKGGLHTPRIKVSSALLRAGMYSGIGCTIVWGVYLLCMVFWFVIMLIALATGLNY
jgi:hypothetical protein